jgi:hypothetical protein
MPNSVPSGFKGFFCVFSEKHFAFERNPAEEAKINSLVGTHRLISQSRRTTKWYSFYHGVILKLIA